MEAPAAHAVSEAQVKAAAVLVLAEEAWAGRRFEASLQLAGQALQLHEHPAGRYARARAWYALGRADEALAECDRALAYAPSDVSVLAYRGVALTALGRLDDAMAALDRALALAPRHPHAMTVRGLLLMQLGMPRAARNQFEVAIAVSPGDVQLRWNRALLLLQLGDFERGWKEYEVRWDNPELKTIRPPLGPMWQGEPLAAGATLLLHCEQGLGDTLQFCRLAPDVAQATGARIVLVVQPPLKRLLAGLPGAAAVLAMGEPLPPHDAWCPLMSVPHALRMREVPAWRGPYLAAPGQAAEQWRGRLPSTAAPRVAFVWRGNPGHKFDSRRSMRLAELLSAMPPGPQYLSLQQRPEAGECELLAARPDVVDLGSGLDDFTDTAALCALADLVVSVDTSVAHLAGALARPTWVMSPFAPDWRWQLERSDSPWYPTVRLFRQERPLDWSGMLRSVRLELQAWVARHASA